MKTISEKILNEEKNRILTLEKMIKNYRTKNKITKQGLSVKQKNAVYINMMGHLGSWLGHRIIFDSKKNNLDEMNINIKDELGILESCRENLCAIQSEFLEDIRENPNHNRKIKALEDDKIFKEFCELYTRIDTNSEKTDRIFIQREITCIGKFISQTEMRIKAKKRTNENDVSQSLSDQETVIAESKKQKSS